MMPLCFLFSEDEFSGFLNDVVDLFIDSKKGEYKEEDVIDGFADFAYNYLLEQQSEYGAGESYLATNNGALIYLSGPFTFKRTLNDYVDFDDLIKRVLEDDGNE